MKTLLLLSLGGILSLQGQTLASANYQIDAATIDNGNGIAASANYSITQSSIGGIYGIANSANYSTGAGPVEQVVALAFFDPVDLKNYDSWAKQFFTVGQPRSGRTFDFDGDGVTNEEEFLALTDPTNPLSFIVLKIESVNRVTNSVVLSFFPFNADSTLRRYELQSSSNLAAAFTLLSASPTARANGTGNFRDNRVFLDGRYYRLKIVIP